MTARYKTSIDHTPIISVVHNRKLADVFDVTLLPNRFFSKGSSYEVHTMMYPYSREVTASHITFLPYEEYTQDIIQGHTSAYEEIPKTLHKTFGIFLGILITAIFVIWYPSGLFSVDSIVSIFGAYFIGKEIWGEIENTLIRVTRNFRIRYTEQYFRYRFEPDSTLTHYSHFAKTQRYGRKTVMADSMDFSRQSNSQTLRMRFTNPVKDGDEAHLFSMHIKKELMPQLKQHNFLFGFKLCSNKRFIGYTRSIELFQSVHNGKIGCLNGDTWIDNAVYQRVTYYFGRIKWVKNSIVMHDTLIVRYS